LTGFVKGHNFSRADKASKINRALAPAEEHCQLLKLTGFVKGHDFSRADKASKINRALAPAKLQVQEIAAKETFPQPLSPLRFRSESSVKRRKAPPNGSKQDSHALSGVAVLLFPPPSRVVTLTLT